MNKIYEKIIEKLEKVNDVKIAVFGDYCLDKYIYSHTDRDELSVETNLIARQFHRKKLAAGVAGTVTNNLRALGAKVFCTGAIGKDGEGWELMDQLHRVGADTRFLYEAEDMCTPTYMKPMIREADGEYGEIGRFDLRNFTPISRETEDRIIENLKKAVDMADGCISVDQFFQRNTGIITDRVRDSLMSIAAVSEKPFLSDSRSFIYEFKQTMIKCNNIELIKYFNGGAGNPEDYETIAECGKRLYESTGKPLFITRGSQGMLVFDEEGVTDVPSFKVEGPLDICGAGDASSAGIITGRALGLTNTEAAVLACCISSITIQQIGTTGTASIPQIVERLKKYM